MTTFDYGSYNSNSVKEIELDFLTWLVNHYDGRPLTDVRALFNKVFTTYSALNCFNDFMNALRTKRSFDNNPEFQRVESLELFDYVNKREFPAKSLEELLDKFFSFPKIHERLAFQRECLRIKMGYNDTDKILESIKNLGLESFGSADEVKECLFIKN